MIPGITEPKISKNRIIINLLFKVTCQLVDFLFLSLRTTIVLADDGAPEADQFSKPSAIFPL
jgi:hypothetical protein